MYASVDERERSKSCHIQWQARCFVNSIGPQLLNMASVITDASISTSTDSNLKRTPPSTMQSAREGSPQKRPKRETKLDRLKAKLKSEATLLKKLVEGELEIVKDTGVVKEPVLLYYCDLCDHILAGEELVESDLTIFKKPFAANFVGENILREKLSPGMLLLRTRLASLMGTLQR